MLRCSFLRLAFSCPWCPDTRTWCKSFCWRFLPCFNLGGTNFWKAHRTLASFCQKTFEETLSVFPFQENWVNCLSKLYFWVLSGRSAKPAKFTPTASVASKALISTRTALIKSNLSSKSIAFYLFESLKRKFWGSWEWLQLTACTSRTLRNYKVTVSVSPIYLLPLGHFLRLFYPKGKVLSREGTPFLSGGGVSQ